MEGQWVAVRMGGKQWQASERGAPTKDGRRIAARPGLQAWHARVAGVMRLGRTVPKAEALSAMGRRAFEDACCLRFEQAGRFVTEVAALQLAAQTWGEGLKRIEAGANKIRNHGGDDGDAPDVVICGHGFKAWLEEQRKPLNSAISLVGSILAQVVDKITRYRQDPARQDRALRGEGLAQRRNARVEGGASQQVPLPFLQG